MIQNPALHFPETPATFSKTSTVEKVEKVERRSGIILDSPEEFAHALNIYNRGVPTAHATEREVLAGIEEQGGQMGVGYALLAGAQNSGGFMDRLTKEAISELRSTGSFTRSFDYDAMGTKFMKTIVEGERVGEKVLLSLSAAYVGSEPERNLAVAMRKPLALNYADALGVLSVVDDWWFNANLEKLLANVTIPFKDNIGKESSLDFSKLATWIGSQGYSGERTPLLFEHDGQTYQLQINIVGEPYLKPQGQSQKYYQQTRGTSVVGGAWTEYGEDGMKIMPRRKAPMLALCVSNQIKTYKVTPSVTAEGIAALQKARDFIAPMIGPLSQ